MCYEHSIELDIYFNVLKSFCIALTPKLFQLTLPSLHNNSLLILYTNNIQYRRSICSNINNDDAQMLR